MGLFQFEFSIRFKTDASIIPDLQDHYEALCALYQVSLSSSLSAEGIVFVFHKKLHQGMNAYLFAKFFEADLSLLSGGLGFDEAVLKLKGFPIFSLIR